jgi:hypothetical protein
MGRTSTVKFLDELTFKAKDYAGSGLYKRLHITSTTACKQGFPDVKTVLFSGTTTGTTSDKLEDSGASFDATAFGKHVYNVTDGTYATVSLVDDTNTLSLSEDIMESGDVYKIYDTIALIGDAAIIVPVTPVTVETKITFGGGSELTFAAGTPVGLGQRVSSISDLDVDDIDCSGYDGETLVFDVLVDYKELTGSDYTEELTLEYIDSKSGSAPEFTRPIKEKGVIRHRKQNLDPERTLSIAQKYQSRTSGFMKLSGRDYILEVARVDDDYLVTTEYDYYYQCYHNAPEISGSTGAQDSTVNFDVTYERKVSIGG